MYRGRVDTCFILVSIVTSGEAASKALTDAVHSPSEDSSAPVQRVAASDKKAQTASLSLIGAQNVRPVIRNVGSVG